MKILFRLFLVFILGNHESIGQGLNHNFLIGITTITDTNVIANRAVLSFSNSTITVSPDSFAMAFTGAQANISDNNGNLLMYTNGCYIADATGNVMQNGDSLNPGDFANSWCYNPAGGMPIPNTCVFLPWPGDSTKYILFHLYFA